VQVALAGGRIRLYAARFQHAQPQYFCGPGRIGFISGVAVASPHDQRATDPQKRRRIFGDDVQGRDGAGGHRIEAP
jgi:hypothetical protein